MAAWANAGAEIAPAWLIGAIQAADGADPRKWREWFACFEFHGNGTQLLWLS